jgi:integral membrane protein
MTPRLLFRIFATAEAFTWAGLITALILRATNVTADAVPIAGGLHGFVFLTYCVVTVFVWVNQRWRAGTGVLGLVLAIVPFATVPFEIVLDKKHLLQGPWRLRRGGDAPQGFIEHVQAWVLRHPIIAIVTALLLVATAFLVLLWLGPPIPKS